MAPFEVLSKRRYRSLLYSDNLGEKKIIWALDDSKGYRHYSIDS